VLSDAGFVLLLTIVVIDAPLHSRLNSLLKRGWRDHLTVGAKTWKAPEHDPSHDQPPITFSGAKTSGQSSGSLLSAKTWHAPPDRSQGQPAISFGDDPDAFKKTWGLSAKTWTRPPTPPPQKDQKGKKSDDTK